MGTSIEDIRGWLERAKEEGATHVIVVCDHFSYEDYPVYVMPGQDAQEMCQKYDNVNMQSVMEVYSMALDLEKQLDELRAFHFDMKPRLRVVK